MRDHPDRGLWERALGSAGLVVAHASVLTDGLREHANVVFPAESYAEKEGTVVHPDGRIQRLRTAIAHPGQVRAGWSVIAEIAKRCGLDLGVLTAGMACKQLAAAVPFYDGLTLEEIGGHGVRWPEREQVKGLDFGCRRSGHGRPVGHRQRSPRQAAACGSAPTGRSGPPPRSRSRRRCTSRSPTSRSSSPPRTRTASESATATRSRSRRTEPGCRRAPRSAPACPRERRSSPTGSNPTRPTR